MLIKSHQVLLTSFGASRICSEFSDGIIDEPTFVTPRYCAPEVAAHEPSGISNDIWSLGCVFLEIWTVLGGKKQEDLTKHLHSAGSCSSLYHQNLGAILSWCDMIRFQIGNPNLDWPYFWIISMLKEEPQARCTAKALFGRIQETNADPNVPFTFTGACCMEGGFLTDKSDGVEGSNRSEQEKIEKDKEAEKKAKLAKVAAWKKAQEEKKAKKEAETASAFASSPAVTAPSAPAAGPTSAESPISVVPHESDVDNLITEKEEEDTESSVEPSYSLTQPEHFDVAAYFTGNIPASREINMSAISASHPERVVLPTSAILANPYNNQLVKPYPYLTTLSRPSRCLFVVTFKRSRAGIYYLEGDAGIDIRHGDLVIVEGDRGCDLGQITHVDVSQEDANKFKAHATDEHFRWLVMLSQHSLTGSSNDSSMLGALARAIGFPDMDPSQLTGMNAQLDQDVEPKAIKRLAQQHEIMRLCDKEEQEAKAKSIAAQKVAEHGLSMEILDAEFQA